MFGKLIREGDPPEGDAKRTHDDDDDSGGEEEIAGGERGRILCIMQYLLEHEPPLLETLEALQRESGVLRDLDPVAVASALALPTAGVLRAALDMHGPRAGRVTSAAGDSAAAGGVVAPPSAVARTVGEKAPGTCVTGVKPACKQLPMNVTCVAFAPSPSRRLAALVGTADKRLRILEGPGGLSSNEAPAEILTVDAPFESPPLSLDVLIGEDQTSSALALLTCMGGESWILGLSTNSDGHVEEVKRIQKFKDHTKHATLGRFAVGGAKFATVSRDRKACFYRSTSSSPTTSGSSFNPAPRSMAAADAEKGRAAAAAATPEKDGGAPSFEKFGELVFTGEVTCCVWIDKDTLTLAVRDDNCLRYVDTAAEGGPKESLRCNMNATGDDIEGVCAIVTVGYCSWWSSLTASPAVGP